MKRILFTLALFLFLAVPRPALAKNFIWPTTIHTITQEFGCSAYAQATGNEPWDPVAGCYFHRGIDIGANCGDEIVSSKFGKVTNAKWDYLYGNWITINDGVDEELYAHLSTFAVEEGQWVTQGQTIGYVGDTGNSFGCHLHFEIRWVGWDWGLVNPVVPLNAE
jgi:murein DD-endopeptidase MepM/ murein hydrolase activator NlpD